MESGYKEYLDACKSGAVATADSLITVDARKIGYTLNGPCTFRHDFLETTKKAMGRTSPVYVSDFPQVDQSGNIAYLTWESTGGSLSTVQMYKIDGAWKVNGGHWPMPEDIPYEE